MSRAAWSRLTIALIALGALAVVSCFQDVGDCPTCPAIDSGRIAVQVPPFGLLDSVQVAMDGGPLVNVPRNRRLTFTHLRAGTHEVTLVRWFSIDGTVTSRPSTLRIKLDRGESRVIEFHNDFPVVGWAPAADPDRTHGSLARALQTHPGWASV